MTKRRLAYVLLIGVAGSIVILAAIVITREQWRYARNVRLARAAYESSRSDPNWQVSSYEFVTRGVTVGETAAEVDLNMKGAWEVLRNNRQDSPPWKGTVNIYRFFYGPSYDNPFLGRKEPLFGKTYYVYFDERGRATRMRRMVFRSDGRVYSPLQEIELCERRISVPE